MKQTNLKRTLSAFLCMVLIAALALTATGCSPVLDLSDGQGKENAIVLGEGANQFYFTVIDVDGNTQWYDIHTNHTIVGDALLELKLIEGSTSAYGLYVTAVTGMPLDFDKDGKYWAFFINGEYASSGVDSTGIVPGETYTFKAE